MDDWSDWCARHDVSRETLERIEAYRQLLDRWARRINLIGPATRDDFWTRHALDSAQLLDIAGPAATRWVDVGTGAGFPGLILAALLANRRGAEVTLIESSTKRCAFLREAVRLLQAPARVVEAKVEDVEPVPADVLTARAFAPLDRFLPQAARYAALGARILLPKGTDVASEVAQARKSWHFEVKSTVSRTDPRGWIIEISELSHA